MAYLVEGVSGHGEADNSKVRRIGEYDALPDAIASAKRIVDGYLRINTICLPADHYRTEEGSEHFVFYELEERLQRSFVHGQIVGLGIYLMSRLQNNEPRRMTQVMDQLRLGYHPADLQITRADLEASLQNLAMFVEQRNHWYSVINERPIAQKWIAESLNSLRFNGRP